MKKDKGVFGYGFDPKKVEGLLDVKINKKVELKPIRAIPATFRKYRHQHKGKNFVTIPKWDFTDKRRMIHGAAGAEDIPQEKLKLMTDPYDSATRDYFTDCILTDPIMSPATDRRVDAMFEDGFHLELIDATSKEEDNTTRTEGEKDEEISEKSTQFDMILQKLETWKDDIDLLSNMRDAAGVSFGQGRAASLISPPLLDLVQGQMPMSVEIIATEDLNEPIVDVGLTKQIVAVHSELDGKPILRPDEMVYLTRGKRGFRKDSKFYGASPLEPILQLSKAIKRIYNYDIPEAIIAAYITKVLFTVQDNGDPSTQATRIQTFVNNYLADGKLAFAMSDEITKIDTIQPKVDTQMIDTLESKLADVELSVVGVPKSMMNREHGLNRDIATIEAIQFIRFVRKPDERLIAEAYENQLLNPLLAIMAGKQLSELPVRVVIVRNDPEKDLDTIFVADALAEKKEGEIESEKLVQDDAVSAFGAKGEYTITSEDGNKYHVSNS